MKNNDIKITIVTITYNLKKAGREQTFRQCVESVHNQTRKNIEHIIVDGASTDGSLDLIKEYAEKGWISYISEPDSGVYDAMNKGLNLATGDYIAFLNSDDYYHDARGVQRVVETLSSSKADFCYGKCNFVTEAGQYYGISKPVIGSFYAHMPFSHQSLFVNTNLMRKLGGFDSANFKNAGDYDFIIRLCLSGAKSCECPLNFVSYRMGGLSEKKHDEGQAECIKSFIKNYSQFYPDLNPEKLLYGLIVPVRLYEKLYFLVSEEIQNQMDNVWKKRIKINDSVAKITEMQIVHIDEKTTDGNIIDQDIYLFDYIKLLKIKQTSFMKTYKLFGCLLILKKLYIGEKIKTRLFGFVPLMSRNKIHYTDYRDIEPGVYSFSGLLPFEVDGLQNPEGWGCWSDGNQTSFYLKTNREYIAEFDLHAFLAPDKPRQVVTVYINGMEKQRYIFEYGKDIQKIILDLPKSKKLKIVFKYQDVLSPADLGISEDTRTITVGFKTLEIRK